MGREAEKVGRLVGTLRERGLKELWLAASADPGIRAHGFYRANGWAPSGRVLESGDEILVLKSPDKG